MDPSCIVLKPAVLYMAISVKSTGIITSIFGLRNTMMYNPSRQHLINNYKRYNFSYTNITGKEGIW